LLTTVEPAQEVLNDPEAFSRSLINGAHAEVLEQSDEGTLFDWGVSLPLIGVDGRMRLSHDGEAMTVEGVSGALEHGRWRFDTHRFPSGEGCIYGVGRFDPRETSAIVRSLIGDDAFFAHGLTAAMQIMVVRSIRKRAIERAVGRRRRPRRRLSRRRPGGRFPRPVSTLPCVHAMALDGPFRAGGLR